MRRFISVFSGCFSIACAVALANTNDNGNPNLDTSVDSQTRQQPGTADSSPTTDRRDADQASVGSSTDNKDAKSATAKSCTDENGVRYKRGKRGFDACLQAKRTVQRGGQLGNDLNTPDVRQMDTN